MTIPDVAGAYAQLKRLSPLVQNITNSVVEQFSANVLLAMGAAPAMIDHEADAAQFARLADALLINFGTATNQQLLAADAAIATARQQAKPWVLDPISIGVLAFRSIKIRQALACNPSVIRGNASEIMALADMGQGGRGVDSLDAVEAALPAAIKLARQTGGIVAISGARDAVVSVSDRQQARVARIEGGSELMPRLVGTGCALGCAVAAYLGAAASPQAAAIDDFTATLAAHAHFAGAGRLAATQARAPGSFAVAFLDALYSLAPQELADVPVSIELMNIPKG